jgi:hypothetical protein
VSERAAVVTADESAVLDHPLFERVERNVPRLARRMVSAFVAEVPIYAQLPREQLEGEIRAITEANLRLFFGVLRTGEPMPAAELAEVRLSAARRAEERVPLDAVLTAYHVGARIGWLALVEEHQPDETDALLTAGARVLAYTQQVTAAVAAAYLDEQQTIFGEERDAARLFASALLSGEPADALAARLGVAIAPAYVVVALRIAAHPDESDDKDVGGAIAARRKIRRVQAALDELSGDSTVTLLDPTGGSVLLPTATEAAPALADRLTDLALLLEKAAGAPVFVGGAIGYGVSELPRAAAQAHDILRLTRTLDKPPGAYLLRDVLLEYQLTRPSDAQAVLASLIEPLDRNPDLLRTLEAYLDADLDRRSTASALHVHPNTFDYRLRRIIDLIGLDPATTHGLQLLGAALAARRLGDSSPA